MMHDDARETTYHAMNERSVDSQNMHARNHRHWQPLMTKNATNRYRIASQATAVDAIRLILVRFF